MDTNRQTNRQTDKLNLYIDRYQYSRNYISDLNETESTLASTLTTIVQSTITLESTQTTASIQTRPSRSTTGRTTTSRTTTRRTTTGRTTTSRSTTRRTTTIQTTTSRSTTSRSTTSRSTTRRTTTSQTTTSQTTSTKRTTRTTRSTTERPQSSDVPNLKHIASILGNQGIFGVDNPINSLDSPVNRLDMDTFYEMNTNLAQLRNDHVAPHNGPVTVSESYTIICTQKGWVEKTGNQVTPIDIYDLKLKCLGNYKQILSIFSQI